MSIFSNGIRHASQSDDPVDNASPAHPTTQYLAHHANYPVLVCLLLIAVVGYIGAGSLSSSNSGQRAASTVTLTPFGITDDVDNAATEAAQSAKLNTPVVNSSVSSTQDTATNGADAADMQASMEITVNGQTIAVPNNGTVSQTVPATEGGGNTTISATNTQASTGTSRNYSFSSTHSSVMTSNGNGSITITTNNSSP